jgi:hypothetical protein
MNAIKTQLKIIQILQKMFGIPMFLVGILLIFSKGGISNDPNTIKNNKNA